jgi:hypothetical protein
LTTVTRPTRDINRQLRAAIAAGQSDIHVLNPEAKHNLGVAVLQPLRVVFEGSVGYYCAGMMDGAHVEVRGSAPAGTAESMVPEGRRRPQAVELQQERPRGLQGGFVTAWLVLAREKRLSPPPVSVYGRR